MVHEDNSPPQAYATNIDLHFKAFLARIWHEGTFGHASQISVVAFDLTTSKATLPPCRGGGLRPFPKGLQSDPKFVLGLPSFRKFS